MPAVFAGLDMAAHRSRTAILDRRHDLQLVEAEIPGVRHPICGPGNPEDVGDLQRGPHLAQPSGDPPSAENSANLSSGLVTARTVRVATCV